MELYACPRMILVGLAPHGDQQGTVVNRDWMQKEGEDWEMLAMTQSEIQQYYDMSDSMDLGMIEFQLSEHGKLTGCRSDDDEEEKKNTTDTTLDSTNHTRVTPSSREYQDKLQEKIRDAFGKIDIFRVQACTSSGKTYMEYQSTMTILSMSPETRVIIVVPKRSILAGFKREMRDKFPALLQFEPVFLDTDTKPRERSRLPSVRIVFETMNPRTNFFSQ